MIKKISFSAVMIAVGIIALVLLWPRNILNHLVSPQLPSESVMPELPRCMITGCSGQICAEEEVITTCEFLSEYACYKDVKCERQSDGQCGWTESAELLTCLGNLPTLITD